MKLNFCSVLEDKTQNGRKYLQKTHLIKKKVTQHIQKTRKSKGIPVFYFCFIDYTKAFDCVDHNKLWNNVKEMGIPDHLTCLLRNLNTGQETTVRIWHRTADWFQIGKGVYQGCILSSCLFNLYAQYTMKNAGLEETQAGIKIAGRNISNLRDAEDTTLHQKVKN